MKPISVQDIRTSLRNLTENTERRELQLEHLNIVGAFCATSYILGSNPLPSLRIHFPGFIWKYIDRVKARKGLPLQNYHFIFEVFPMTGFGYVVGTALTFDDIYGKKVFLSSKEHNPPTPQISEEDLQRARFLVDVKRTGFWCSHYQSV